MIKQLNIQATLRSETLQMLQTEVTIPKLVIQFQTLFHQTLIRTLMDLRLCIPTINVI